MPRLIIAAAIIALVIWGVRVWRQYQLVIQKERELSSVGIEEEALDLDEKIADKRDDIRQRREALTVTQKTGE